MLQLLTDLTLHPAVAAAAAVGSRRRQALGGSLDGARLRRGFGSVEQRERTHLLALYAPLARCVACGEPRLRAALRTALLLAGQELGLVALGEPVVQPLPQPQREQRAVLEPSVFDGVGLHQL